MRILTVIPIRRGIGTDTLTYFTSLDVPTGSVVSIPLRNKTIFGIVTDSRDASLAKSEIKSLSYNIKKIEDLHSHTLLSPTIVQSAGAIAEYCASSIGAVLAFLLPRAILESIDKLETPQAHTPSDSFYETTLLQSDKDERYAVYKSLIREEFAKGHSVFFCLPTTEDVRNASGILEKGIEAYTYSIHSSLPKKKIIDSWNNILKESHPVLVIGTMPFLSIPRNDLCTIILENESSRGYKLPTRPFIDMRTAVEIIAKESNKRLILGDTLLRIETLWEHKSGTYAELSPLKFRSLSTAECELVSMRRPEDQKKKTFEILGEEAKQIISRGHETGERTFLFCSRKGLYPSTVCSDCGTTVVCNNCNAPVVLYGKKSHAHSEGNLFVCHHCGERRDAQELCKYCGGWRLTPLGIATDRVALEIETLFPKSPLYIMDKEHIKNHTEATKVRDSFYAAPGGIMIGTEMALPYLAEHLENSIVVSLDSFFSIPDFRIHEKIFHILLSLRTISDKHLLVQTRQEKTKIFDDALRGNMIDFFRDEIEERKLIGYPPFATYIKITLEGEKQRIKKEMEQIKTFLSPYTVSVFDAFNPGSTKQYTIHGLVTLKKGQWVDKTLLQKLRQLPPYVAIKIDPDTLL